MSIQCQQLHQIFNNAERQNKIDPSKIPTNGIYIFFQVGEESHQGDRIVRIGTHTKDGNLRARLENHLRGKNKDGSIFMKHLGRALLNKRKDYDLLEHWSNDQSKKDKKDVFKARDDYQFLKNEIDSITEEVSEILKSRFSFLAFSVSTKEERLKLESKIISTVSLCKECGSSQEWLGNYIPTKRYQETIVKSGLWNVKELFVKEYVCDTHDLEKIRSLVNK